MEEIRDMIEADSLRYISLEGLLESSGDVDSFCNGCFSGNYPINKEEKNVFNI